MRSFVSRGRSDANGVWLGVGETLIVVVGVPLGVRVAESDDQLLGVADAASEGIGADDTEDEYDAEPVAEADCDGDFESQLAVADADAHALALA